MMNHRVFGEEGGDAARGSGGTCSSSTRGHSSRARPHRDQSFAAELTDRGGFDLVVEIAHDMSIALTSILLLSEILHRGALLHVN
jgi:hypothetical protein